jgi:hypothetical protein
MELLVVHDQPLGFEHDADPAIAKAAALARDLTHGNTDVTVVWRAFAPDSLGIDTNHHAGPALGDLKMGSARLNTPLRVARSSRQRCTSACVMACSLISPKTGTSSRRAYPWLFASVLGFQ